MKKILAVTLAMLMVLTSALSAGTAFALTEGSGAEGDYLVVSENFEDSQNKINTYVDQTLQTEKDFSLVSSEVYGIGKAYKSGRSTGRLEAYGNFPVMNTTSQNSKPNFYIETEIDVVLNSEYSGNVQTADLFVVGRQNGGNYDDVAKIILNKETKTFGLTAWATEKAGARTTLDLKVGYELGKTYRIKLVFHATDSNCGAAKEITGVYINGVNALGKNGVPEKYYMVQKASQIENIRMQIANLNLYDNYAMYAYQSADGKSPAVNKGALVSLIRQADTGNEEVIYYAALNAAKVVYENAGATQAEVD